MFGVKMIDLKVISPTEFKVMIKSKLTISYGYHDSPFGNCLIALLNKRICFLSFFDKSEKNTLKKLSEAWPGADLSEDKKGTAGIVSDIFKSPDKKLCVVQKGTNFQQKVWEGLVNIPSGTVLTYEKFAEKIGTKNAIRATGSALGKHNVAYLLPCHRVVAKTASAFKYRWGAELKKKILTFENVNVDNLKP